MTAENLAPSRGAQIFVPARGHGPENRRAALKFKVKPSGD